MIADAFFLDLLTALQAYTFPLECKLGSHIVMVCSSMGVKFNTVNMVPVVVVQGMRGTLSSV